MTKPLREILSGLTSAFRYLAKGHYSELKSLCEFLMLKLPDATRHGESIKVNYHADKNFGDRISLQLSNERGMFIGREDDGRYYAQHITPTPKVGEVKGTTKHYDSISDLIRTEVQRIAPYLTKQDAHQLAKNATELIRIISGDAQATPVTLAASPSLLAVHSTQAPMVALHTFLQSTLDTEDRHGNAFDLTMRGNKGATIVLKIGEDHSINISRGEDGRCLIQRQVADPEFKGGGFLMTHGTGSSKDPELRIQGAAQYFTKYIASFLTKPVADAFLQDAMAFIANDLDDSPTVTPPRTEPPSP